MKLYRSLAPYEYGFRVILFTYCLIIISGYRMGNPIRTAMDRLYSIGIGGIVTVLVNSIVFPIWAGEQLHRELVQSFNAVADSLEGSTHHRLGFSSMINYKVNSFLSLSQSVSRSTWLTMAQTTLSSRSR